MGGALLLLAEAPLPCELVTAKNDLRVAAGGVISRAAIAYKSSTRAFLAAYRGSFDVFLFFRR